MEHLWVWRCIVCNVVQYECGHCYTAFYLPHGHNCTSHEIERMLNEEFDEGFHENVTCAIVRAGCTCSACACRHQLMCIREPREVREMWDLYVNM